MVRYGTVKPTCCGHSPIGTDRAFRRCTIDSTRCSAVGGSVSRIQSILRVLPSSINCARVPTGLIVPGTAPTILSSKTPSSSMVSGRV